jgi:hypothetical protein
MEKPLKICIQCPSELIVFCWAAVLRLNNGDSLNDLLKDEVDNIIRSFLNKICQAEH